MNWHPFIAYWRFLLQSTNEHGVHSPFVFSWITRCLYDRKAYPAYSQLKTYASELNSSADWIDVVDCGAGSRVFAQSRRKVSSMAKSAGSTAFRSQLLYRCAAYFEPECILELGTSLGKGTLALALGAPKARILSLEGCPNTAAFSRQKLENYPNITIRQTSFDDFFANKDAFPPLPGNSLVFIDGHHQGEALLRYCRQLLPFVTEDTVWILDDIHWSKDMETAWETLKTWNEIPVTVDTYRWGFVFFRYGQAEEHFVVRP